MINYRLLSVFFVAFFMSGSVFAQDNQPDSSWPVVEKCLPSPSMPDDNWTFDGEILMRGWGGIHGVNASLETPYVVYWGGGYEVISPNGQWVLDQNLHIYNEQLTGGGPLGRHHFYYGNIIVENLTTGQKITFDWESYISITSRPYLAGPAGPFWLDDQHFVSFGEPMVERPKLVTWKPVKSLTGLI
jgi:hypothetical protein